jgi:hypothetical protein
MVCPCIARQLFLLDLNAEPPGLMESFERAFAARASYPIVRNRRRIEKPWLSRSASQESRAALESRKTITFLLPFCLPYATLLFYIEMYEER